MVCSLLSAHSTAKLFVCAHNFEPLETILYLRINACENALLTSPVTCIDQRLEVGEQ